MNQSIPLSEKIYLLGIHPSKGGIIISARKAMDFVLPGSLFMELWLNKNIEFENKRIVVRNSQSKERLHHFLLDKMKKKDHPVKISMWIRKLHFSSNFIRHEIQQSLVSKRIIKLENRQFLFFRWKKPVLINKQPVFHLVDNIEKQIFYGTPNEEEILLLSFLKPAGLLKRIFPERTKRNQAKIHIKKLTVENPVSVEVARAIRASQAVAASVATSAAIGSH